MVSDAGSSAWLADVARPSSMKPSPSPRARPLKWKSLAHNPIPVSVIHISICWIAASDGGNPMPASLGAGYSTIFVIIVEIQDTLVPKATSGWIRRLNALDSRSICRSRMMLKSNIFTFVQDPIQGMGFFPINGQIVGPPNFDNSVCKPATIHCGHPFGGILGAFSGACSNRGLPRSNS